MPKVTYTLVTPRLRFAPLFLAASPFIAFAGGSQTPP